MIYKSVYYDSYFFLSGGPCYGPVGPNIANRFRVIFRARRRASLSSRMGHPTMFWLA